MNPAAARRSGQIVEVDIERGGDLLQRGDRAFALAVLDLRQVADTDPGALGELAQRVAAMLAPYPDRVLSGDQPVDYADRHALLVAGAVIGGSCRSVFDQLGKVVGCHDHELGAVRVVDELGAGQPGETIAHQRGMLAKGAQSQRVAHRYAPPLGAISKTLMTPAS